MNFDNFPPNLCLTLTFDLRGKWRLAGKISDSDSDSVGAVRESGSRGVCGFLRQV